MTFKSEAKRVLHNEDLTVADIAAARTVNGVVSGFEVGRIDGTRFYVSAAHIVEWWDATAPEYRIVPA